MLESLPGPVLTGLLLGVGYGALAQRTHFCTMGALADFALFGDRRRLQAWLLAIGVALAGTQALALGGAIDPPTPAAPGVPSAVLGGLMFGYGMTLTGGCVSRNLVLLGTGSLKAGFVLLVVILLASATLGIPTDLRAALDGLAPLPEPIRGSTTTLVLGLAGGLAIVAWCLLDARFRKARRELAAGSGIGLLIVLGWLASGTSLNPLLGLGGWLSGNADGFLIASVVGVPLGALAVASAKHGLRITSFADHADFRRHLGGAVMMGAGGGLALGCTLGQGVSGVAAFAPPAGLALVGFALGGFAGIRALEHGSFRGALRARFAGVKG